MFHCTVLLWKRCLTVHVLLWKRYFTVLCDCGRDVPLYCVTVEEMFHCTVTGRDVLLYIVTVEEMFHCTV